MESQTQVLYSSLPRRLKASIIDSVVLLTAFILCTVLVGILKSSHTGLNAVAMFTPPFLIEPFFISYFGCTLGQYVFGIRVQRLNTFDKCPLIPSFARYIAKILLGGFSVVYMLFSKKHQAIHDYIANTVVVLSEKKILDHPEFAEVGEKEQSFDGAFIYPSSLRRFAFFLIWLVPVFFGFFLLVEIAALLFIPGYTLESKRYPDGIEIATNGIGTAIFIALAVAAAKGYLPGAKRKKDLSKTITN